LRAIIGSDASKADRLHWDAGLQIPSAAWEAAMRAIF